MHDLLIYLDTIDNGLNTILIEIIHLIAITLAVAIITYKNPMNSLLSLIGLFGCISVYLILIGLNFLGFSYLIVYIGAISMLFLFVLMLLNIKESEIKENQWVSLPLAFLILIILDQVFKNFYSENDTIFMTIYLNAANNLEHFSDIFNDYGKSIYVLFVTSKNWDTNIVETENIVSLGLNLYTHSNIWLLMASLILILAMVGCIYITLNKGD